MVYMVISSRVCVWCGLTCSVMRGSSRMPTLTLPSSDSSMFASVC